MYEYEAVVKSIYDGDTVTLDVDLGCFVWKANEKCRLYGIDTPELRGSEKIAGKAARDFLRAILPDGSLITIKTQLDKSGKYGRLLVEIFCDLNNVVGWLMRTDKTVQSIVDGQYVLKEYFIKHSNKKAYDPSTNLVNLNQFLIMQGHAVERFY